MKVFSSIGKKESAPIIWFTACVLILLGIEFGVTQTSAYPLHGGLFSTAIALDICLGVPLLYWLLIVRPRGVDAITIVPVFVAAFIVTKILIPRTYHDSLAFIEYGVVAVELSVLGFGVFKTRQIVREYKRLRLTNHDFLQNLRQSFVMAFGGKESVFVRIFTSEIAMIRYAFFWGGKEEIRPEISEARRSFTTYRKSGYTALLFGFLSMCVIEGVGMHILVAIFWSEVVAMILTALSVYTVLFLVADFVAILKRPIVVEQSHLVIRTGTRWNATIPLHAIANVEIASKKRDDDQSSMLKITPFGNPNVILRLNTTHEVEGLYGIKRKASVIGCFLDKPQDFVELIQNSIGNNNDNY